MVCGVGGSELAPFRCSQMVERIRSSHVSFFLLKKAVKMGGMDTIDLEDFAVMADEVSVSSQCN